MNICVIIGRATKVPELKYIPSTGTAVATLTLAVDRDFKGKDGKKITDFFNIVVWGKTAEYVSNYLSKGKLCAIKGRIENRSYEDKQGNKKYITEIVAETVEILEWEKKEKTEVTEIEGFKAIDDPEVPF